MSTGARLLTMLVLVILGPGPLGANVPNVSHRAVTIFTYDAGRVSTCGYDNRGEHAERGMCPRISRPTVSIGFRRCCTLTSIRQRFTGKERDRETATAAGNDRDALDYFGARYFSGVQGRFTSPDAPGADWSLEDPQSWYLYGYVRNSPLRFIDPFGRECVALDGGGMGDDGAGKPCQDKSLLTRHGATINGSTGAVAYATFGDAVEIGDIDLSGRKDFVVGYEAEDVMSTRGGLRNLFQNPFRSGTAVVLGATTRHRMNVRKPRLVTHPNRDPRSGKPNANKTAQPGDAELVFETAIPDPADPTGHKWWARASRVRYTGIRAPMGRFTLTVQSPRVYKCPRTFGSG